MAKDLLIAESYTKKDGTKMTSFNKIGFMFESNGKEYVKLFHIPNTIVLVKSQEKKEYSEEPNGNY